MDNQTEVIRCYIHDQKVGQDIWDDTIEMQVDIAEACHTQDKKL